MFSLTLVGDQMILPLVMHTISVNVIHLLATEYQIARFA